MLQPLSSPARRLAALLAFLLLTHCGGGGGSDGSQESTTLDLTLEDAPLEGLLALRATVTSARLVRPDGTPTDNLLPGPAPVEFLGLQDRSLWLGRVEVPSGSYVGADLLFADGSVVAEARDGDTLRLNVTSHLLALRFEAPTTLGSSARLRMDLDVGRSLRGQVDRPPLEFVPTGSITVDRGPSLSIEPLRATFEGLEDGGLRLRGRRGESDRADPETLMVTVDPDTVLLTLEGRAQDLTRWAKGLIAGRSTLELAADLVQGDTLKARRISVLSVDGSDFGLSVDGLLLGSAVTHLELLVQETHGKAVRDILARQPDPDRPRFLLNDDTVILGIDDQPATLDDLQIGQRLRLRFTDTDAGLSAQLLAIDAPARVQLEVVDDAGLPTEALVHLRADDPWVEAGLVADARTDVRLDLRGATLQVDGSDLKVSAEDLAVGSTLIMEGLLSGSPTAPDFEGRRGLLRQGTLTGCVTDARPGRDRFDCRVTAVIEPFSRDPRPLALATVVVQDATRFSGIAGDSREFFRQWAELNPDQILRVEVQGLLNPRSEVVVASSVVTSIGLRYRDGDELWPPNHRLVAVDLLCEADLRDDRGRPLTQIEVLSITQDEPVNAKGDGNTSPDATGVGGDTVAVRAERSGKGDGRVYAIHFRGLDGDGLEVEQTLHLCVPHSQNGDPAGDDGQDYDSTADD